MEELNTNAVETAVEVVKDNFGQGFAIGTLTVGGIYALYKGTRALIKVAKNMKSKKHVELIETETTMGSYMKDYNETKEEDEEE